jgi:preprotein translocase subunit YajC
MIDLAHAASQSPGGGGAGSIAAQLLFFVAIFAVFYFLLIRPQQRQRRERESLLAAVKRGDRVVTTGGLHGTVVGLDEHKVTLRVTDQVKIDFDRAAIGRIVPAGGEKDQAS